MLASASSFKGIQMNTKTGNETNMADARRAVVCSLIEGFTYDSMLEASRSEDWSSKFPPNKQQGKKKPYLYKKH